MCVCVCVCVCVHARAYMCMCVSTCTCMCVHANLNLEAACWHSSFNWKQTKYSHPRPPLPSPPSSVGDEEQDQEDIRGRCPDGHACRNPQGILWAIRRGQEGEMALSHSPMLLCPSVGKGCI